MSEIQVGDFVVFKEAFLNILTGNTPKKVIKTYNQQIQIEVFICSEQINKMILVDTSRLIKL